MESEVEIIRNVTLKLQEPEALWLMGIMQNPIFDSPEDSMDYAYRMTFFNELKKAFPTKPLKE